MAAHKNSGMEYRFNFYLTDAQHQKLEQIRIKQGMRSIAQVLRTLVEMTPEDFVPSDASPQQRAAPEAILQRLMELAETDSELIVLERLSHAWKLYQMLQEATEAGKKIVLEDPAEQNNRERVIIF